MTAKAHKVVFEVIELFYILILKRSMQKYPSVKIHQTTLKVEVFLQYTNHISIRLLLKE